LALKKNLPKSFLSPSSTVLGILKIILALSSREKSKSKQKVFGSLLRNCNGLICTQDPIQDGGLQK
jgi:hypothetical protein